VLVKSSIPIIIAHTLPFKYLRLVYDFFMSLKEVSNVHLKYLKYLYVHHENDK